MFRSRLSMCFDDFMQNDNVWHTVFIGYECSTFNHFSGIVRTSPQCFLYCNFIRYLLGEFPGQKLGWQFTARSAYINFRILTFSKFWIFHQKYAKSSTLKNISKLHVRGCRIACGHKKTGYSASETPGSIYSTLQFCILTFFKIFKIFATCLKIWID